MTSTRRSFVALLGTGLAAAASLSLVGCGDDSDSNGGGDCDQNGTASSIGTNHGHELVVPAQDVSAGAEKSYDITGVSDHPHTVTLTADHFAQLQNGESVTVMSTNDASHAHSVTVQCG